MQSINRELELFVKTQNEGLLRQAKELEESKTQNDVLQRALKDEIEKVRIGVSKMLGIFIGKNI